MRRLRIAAGWVGLLVAAPLVALLVVSVQSSAKQRDRALELSEDTLVDLRRTRSAFREERDQLNRRIDLLLSEVQDLTDQVGRLRRQVVELGGDPFGQQSQSQPQPQSHPRSQGEPQVEAQPKGGGGGSGGGGNGEGKSKGKDKGKGPDGDGPPGHQSDGCLS